MKFSHALLIGGAIAGLLASPALAASPTYDGSSLLAGVHLPGHHIACYFLQPASGDYGSVDSDTNASSGVTRSCVQAVVIVDSLGHALSGITLTTLPDTAAGDLAAIRAAAVDNTTQSPVKSSSSSGVLAPISVPDASPFLNMSTATTTKIITGVVSKVTKISAFGFHANGATNGKLVTGTGSNCGTGTADLTATFQFVAGDGFVFGSGSGRVLPNVAASTDICAVNSAAQPLQVQVAFTQEP